MVGYEDEVRIIWQLVSAAASHFYRVVHLKFTNKSILRSNRAFLFIIHDITNRWMHNKKFILLPSKCKLDFILQMAIEGEFKTCIKFYLLMVFRLYNFVVFFLRILFTSLGSNQWMSITYSKIEYWSCFSHKSKYTLNDHQKWIDLKNKLPRICFTRA